MAFGRESPSPAHLPVSDLPLPAGCSVAARTAFAAARLGARLEPDRVALTDVYYAALLKDRGATAARSRALHTFGPASAAIYPLIQAADLSSVRGSVRLALPLLRSGGPWRTRLAGVLDIVIGRARYPAQIERLRGRMGASIACEMGFTRATADAILARNERWDGRGRPEACGGEAVALGGRLLAAARALVSAWFAGGADEAKAQLARRAGNQLDPELASHAASLLADPGFVAALGSAEPERVALDAEPTGRGHASSARADRLIGGFARFIDAKSPWTYQHSERVRELAVGAALQLEAPLQLGPWAIRRLGRATWLHDIARLAAPSAVLDSHQSLSDAEIELVRSRRPLLLSSLSAVLDLADLAPVTETHPLRDPPLLEAGSVLGPGRKDALVWTLLDQAEKFEAMTAPRPHRERRTFEEAVSSLRSEAMVGDSLCRAALSALERFLTSSAAAAVLAPRTFDPNAIMIVD